MVDYKQLTAGTIGTCVSAIAINVEDLGAVESIVGIVCTILGLVITIISCVVIPLIRWYRNAKKDGKISADEIEEGMNTLKDGLSQIKDKLENKEEEHHNDNEER